MFSLPLLAPIYQAGQYQSLACLCELNDYVYLHVLKFQKRKQQFQKFFTIPGLNENVSTAIAHVQSNNKSQDIPRKAKNGKQGQGIPSSTLPLSPQHWVHNEQSATEILHGVKKEMQVEYLNPAQGQLPHKQVQGISNCTLPPSLQQGVNHEHSATEIPHGVRYDVKADYFPPAREELPSETGMGILYYAHHLSIFSM